VKKIKSILAHVTFWKIFTFFLIQLILVLWYGLDKDAIDKRPSDVERSISDRVRQISKALEVNLITQRVNEVQELVTLLEPDFSDSDTLLSNWLSRRDEIISIALWIRGRNLPISNHRNLWHVLQDRNMSDVDRQNLLSHFLNNKMTINNTGKGWHTGELIPDTFLGYFVLPVGIFFENDSRVASVEIKLGLGDIENVFAEILQEGEALTIFNRSDIPLFPSGADRVLPEELPETEAIVRIEDYLYMRYPLFIPTWYLLLSKELPPLSSLRFQAPPLRWTFIVFGLLIVLLFSILLSLWIEHPHKKLIQTATEMARGHFDHRLPPQNNKTMDRLVKLFNYMAEEMDRLQKMDVSEIITEKNKTETILRHIADGVVVTDTQDRILVINSVAEKWFGLDERNVIQKAIRESIKNQPLISLLQEVKDGRLHSSAEFSFLVKATKMKKVFQAHAARVHNPEDKLIGVVTVIRDVTREKEADRIKTELVSMVAHELKSPLTSIYGFSELLLDSELNDPKANEYARVILTESTRLTDLINKFLDLSRLEAGRTEIKMNPFDLRQVVEKIVDVYKGQAVKKDIKVITEIPKKLPLAFGDPDMIEQVLLNLFSNAVKYSPKHSKVGIEAKVNKNEIVVSVIDNGYGIPKEALGHIFDKFYRVSDTEGSEETEGSGLGLTLAKEIIERHDGTVNVNSRLGIGSIFSFTIPQAKK